LEMGTSLAVRTRLLTNGIRDSRSPGQRGLPRYAHLGETPSAPIRGLPRAWAALVPRPRPEGPQGPAARG